MSVCVCVSVCVAMPPARWISNDLPTVHAPECAHRIRRRLCSHRHKQPGTSHAALGTGSAQGSQPRGVLGAQHRIATHAKNTANQRYTAWKAAQGGGGRKPHKPAANEREAARRRAWGRAVGLVHGDQVPLTSEAIHIVEVHRELLCLTCPDAMPP